MLAGSGGRREGMVVMMLVGPGLLIRDVVLTHAFHVVLIHAFHVYNIHHEWLLDRAVEIKLLGGLEMRLILEMGHGASYEGGLLMLEERLLLENSMVEVIVALCMLKSLLSMLPIELFLSKIFVLRLK